MRTSTKIFRSILAYSILLGTLFVPVRAAEASFLSSFFSDQVYADTSADSTNNANIIIPPQSGSNSQSSALALQVSDSSQIKDNKGNDNSTTAIDGTGTAIIAPTGPMGVSDGTDTPDSSSDQTSIYVVRKGDSLSQIANMFGVSVNTILAANDMKKSDKLTENEVLLILPISGIQHTVKKGQTLKSIAKLYNVDMNDIASYNGISVDAKLSIGDQIMVPGADIMSDEGGDKPAPNLGSSVATDEKYYATHLLQTIVDYFINPLPAGHKTQGLHGPGHRGIDIGAPMGTPILASANGVVSLAHTGWSGGYGNMIIIDHPNGTKTLYGHMSKISTYTGASVNQGEVIGYVGSTGHSTGPHLHFEVFNAKNPGADWSWKPF